MRTYEKRCCNLDQELNTQPDLELLKEKEEVIKKTPRPGTHIERVLLYVSIINFDTSARWRYVQIGALGWKDAIFSDVDSLS